MRAQASVAETALQSVQAGDCVAIVFPNGWRKIAQVELALPTSLTCWGFPFSFPEYTWNDRFTGETLRLDPASTEERREFWRLVARGRLAQFDWESSDRLSDSQLERIIAILDENSHSRTAFTGR